jgi:hypothetical protein
MSAKFQLHPVVTVLDTPLAPNRSLEVEAVEYSSSGLRIKISSASGGAEVLFHSLIGFRVLDEGDLTEFWSHCSLNTGWLFEVHDGGWKELELHREHFVSALLYEVREFLVIGFDSCVNIMSREAPEVHVQPALTQR